MVNYNGNPNIREYGRATRFGGDRNCPYAANQKASPPWAIRKAVKRIAVVEFTIKNTPTMGITLKDLLKVFSHNGKNITIAERIAARLFYKALEGHFGASQRITDMVDGRP